MLPALTRRLASSRLPSSSSSRLSSSLLSLPSRLPPLSHAPSPLLSSAALQRQTAAFDGRARGTCLNGSVLLRRGLATIPPQPSWAPYPARADGLVPKIWYRPDGTPRSKLKGAVFAGLTVFSLLVFSSALEIIEEYDQANFMLAFLVYAQRADSTFTSLHPTFDASPTPALAKAYFYDLCAALPDAPPETLLEFFAAIDAAMDVAHEEILGAAEEVFMTFALDVRRQLASIEKEGAMRAAYNVLSLLRLTIAALGEMNEVVAVKGRGEFGSGLGGVLKKRGEERKGEEYESIG
ncbi:hypothetical protein DFP72DRAFT_1143362 [Ephemerocybe angulata]|uniref:Uncharacterized protein n=1 Tax=Ephemerocybe angulata TaxID=980116 RepID=A0A8H6HL65_9AGAR|nr:hypothetical protein DFP72DRAFT_1143362 [Tulosesus angulatus]